MEQPGLRKSVPAHGKRKALHDFQDLIPTLCSTGSKGNLCQRKVPLSLSLALTVPAAVLAVYYLLLQTYSLRLEAFLSAILLLFYSLELLLGVLALLSFSRCRIPGAEGAGAGAARLVWHPHIPVSVLFHSADPY